MVDQEVQAKEKNWTKGEVFAQNKKLLGYSKEGRFNGFDMGNGWRTGPWECDKGHWVPNSQPACPACRKEASYG